MRRLWVMGALAPACGPIVGMPGESADGGSSESTTSVGSGADATSSSTTGTGTTSPGTATSATSVGDTGGSEGADESTGAEPPACGRDSTPVGPGMIEWEHGQQEMRVPLAVAVGANALTVVGEPLDDGGGAAIRRFDLAGELVWSTSWSPGGSTDSEPQAVMALPSGLVVVHVPVHDYSNGGDWSALVALDETAQVVWETPLYMDAISKHGYADVTPAGNVVVVHRFDETPYGLHLTEVDGDGVVVAETFTETPWLNPYDVAAGPSGEILGSGEVDIDDALDIGYIARWLPTHELDLWVETPDTVYTAVEGLSNGNIVAGSYIDPNVEPPITRLHIFDPNGVQLHVIYLPFFAFDLEIDCADRIVVGGEHGAMVVEGDGSILWTLDLESGAWSVAVDPGDDVFGVGAINIENDDWLVDLRRISGT